MANTYDFSNFNLTVLAQGLATNTVSVVVSTGTGAAFPSPPAGVQFALVLNDAASRTKYEICYCTARSGDTLTVLRAQEGTTAQTWSIGDYCWCGTTAGTQANMVQIPAMTNGSISPIFGYTIAEGGIAVSGFDPNGLNIRWVTGNYGVGVRNDGSTSWFLQTASGNPYGTYNTFRPFAWNLATGAVTIDGTGVGVTFGGSTQINGSNTVSGNSTIHGSEAITGGLTAGSATIGDTTISGAAVNVGVNNASAVLYLANADVYFAYGSGYTTLNLWPGSYIQFDPANSWVYIESGAGWIGVPNLSGAEIQGTYITSTGNVNAANGFTGGPAGINSTGGANFNGDVAANNGYLRASYGTNYNPGDGNAATLGYQFTTNGGLSGYFLCPCGAQGTMYFQWGYEELGSPQNVGFPAGFPHACLGVVCCEGAAGGTWGGAAPSLHGQSGFNNSYWIHYGLASSSTGPWYPAELTCAWFAWGY